MIQKIIIHILFILSMNGVNAQYSNAKLNKYISKTYHLKIDSLLFNSEERELKESKILEFAKISDLSLMLTDSNEYINYLGFKGFHEKRILDLERQDKKTEKSIELKNILNRIKVNFDKNGLSFYYYGGERDIFKNLSKEELELLMEIENPVLKWLAFRTYVIHHDKKLYDIKIGNVKKYIRNMINNHQYISVRLGCVIQSGELPLMMYYTTEHLDHVLNIDKIRTPFNFWKNYFKNSGYDIDSKSVLR